MAQRHDLWRVQILTLHHGPWTMRPRSFERARRHVGVASCRGVACHANPRNPAPAKSHATAFAGSFSGNAVPVRVVERAALGAMRRRDAMGVRSRASSEHRRVQASESRHHRARTHSHCTCALSGEVTEEACPIPAPPAVVGSNTQHSPPYCRAS